MKEDSVQLINSGMEFQIIPYEDENLENEGYTKLPRDVFEKISISLQVVPGQLLEKVTVDAATRSMEQMTKNAYKLVLKDGMLSHYK